MTSCGYVYKGYSTQDGVGSSADDWNKSSFSSSSSHGGTNHMQMIGTNQAMFRPVLIDAEGRKRPVIAYNTPNNNSEYYVSRTETTVHSTVNAPLVSDYDQSIPIRSEPVKTYGGIRDDKWSRPSSLAQRTVEEKRSTQTQLINGFPKKVDELANEVQSKTVLSPCNLSPVVSDYKNGSITKVVPLGTSNGPVEKYLGRPSSPVDGFSQKVDDYISRVQSNYRNSSAAEDEPVKTNGGVTEKKSDSPTSPVTHSEPVNGVPKKADDFNNKAQSVQNVFSPLVSDYRQSPSTKVEPLATNGPVSTPGDDQKFNEFINKVQIEASRPRFGPLGAAYRQTAQVTPRYGYGSDLDSKAGQTASEPAMVSSGRRHRPSHVTWALPPEGSLTKPTNDSNTAMGNLTEIAKPSPVINAPPVSQVTMGPVSTGLRTDAYTSANDNTEAARRYGNFKFPSRYTTTIDSTEAARKYGGTNV